MAVSVYAAPLVEPPSSAVNAGTAPENVPTLVVRLLFIVAAALAVIYLILGGIRWITSRGDKVGVEAARKQIVAAIIGIVVVAGAFFILNVVFKLLGITNNPLSAEFQLPSLQNPNP